MTTKFDEASDHLELCLTMLEKLNEFGTPLDVRTAVRDVTRLMRIMQAQLIALAGMRRAP